MCDLIAAGAGQLARYITNLAQLEFRELHAAYEHMGALLTDAVLQPGLNYRTVVRPRVQRVLQQFPQATTTIDFWEILNIYGSQKVLSWSNPIKPERLEKLTFFLLESGVYTVNAFHTWLLDAENIIELQELKGIGPKTVDYIQKLAGIDEIAVDRHIRSFVSNAGLNYTEYSEIKAVVEKAADLLDVSRASLDQAIWEFESTSQNRNTSAQYSLFQ